MPRGWAAVSLCAGRWHQRIPRGHSQQCSDPEHECSIVYLITFKDISKFSLRKPSYIVAPVFIDYEVRISLGMDS